MPETKPCPFCGSVHSTVGYIGYKRVVICDVCGSQGQQDGTEAGAVELWNQRAGA